MHEVRLNMLKSDICETEVMDKLVDLKSLFFSVFRVVQVRTSTGGRGTLF